ncbi:MAG: DUF2059 domain-containing protein [Collimonas sp.]|uniref:DUF2059 domain-containing protein n=1 Tax=Collimonas sp. TaxID=1963772 RepID=UPI003263FCC7
MRRFFFLFFAIFLTTAAHAAPPSDVSIDDLLVSMKTEQTLKAVFPMIDKVMQQSMAMATKGKTLNAKQQQALESIAAKMVQVMREEMSWDTMRPLYLQIYRESFTQDEIDGLAAFYKSPAGAAYIEKMPVVIQKSMTIMQSRMGPMMAKMQAAIKQAVEEAQKSQ